MKGSIEMEKKLADLINPNDIKFEARKRVRNEQAVVHYSPSRKVLTFNQKMQKILGIENWSHATIGWEKKHKVLVLKCAEAEDFGSFAFYPSKTVVNGKTMNSSSKTICIGPVVASCGFELQRAYRAERAGSLVYLQGIEEN
jgi:hypothetical protein